MRDARGEVQIVGKGFKQEDGGMMQRNLGCGSSPRIYFRKLQAGTSLVINAPSTV